MLEHHRDLVRATVPVLKEQGEAITSVFYRDLFQTHPELYNIFNPANQRNGGQARSLAASILSYAAHIDHLDQLGGMVERIAQKHASLEVQPEHYPIVGKHLLGAIRTVLGEAATPEILEAWSAAYQQLAAIMIGREQEIYHQSAAQPGGWRGFKPFIVQRTARESAVMTSFYLVPEDGQPLPPFRPGQYISLRLHIPGTKYAGIRQYSLSHVPETGFYRISVKRETGPFHEPQAPAGLISNYLHDHVKEGDRLLVHMPQGDFALDETSTRPVVLLSAGSGITPAFCMLQRLAREGTRRVLFVHATTERAHHAFDREVRAIATSHPNVDVAIYYEHVDDSDVHGTHYDEIGRVSADSLWPYLPEEEADYYYCGPVGFLNALDAILNQLRVPLARRFSEAFAPDPSFETELATA